MFNNKARPSVPGTTTQILTGRPTCEAVFYRWDNPSAVKIEKLDLTSSKSGVGDSALSTRETVVVNNDILACSIKKSKSGPAGNFRIILRAGRVGSDEDTRSTKSPIDYLKAISAGDWCSIYIKKSNPEVNTGSAARNSGLRMVGIVDSVELNEKDDPATGTPEQFYIIQGRDFGKVFESAIYFNPYLDQATQSTLFGASFITEALQPFKSLESKEAGSTADELITALVNHFFGGQFDKNSKEYETFYIPPQLARVLGTDINSKPKPSFIDVLDFKSRVGLAGINERRVAPLNGKTIFLPSMPTTGNIWGILGYFSNSLINEMFCELAPDEKGNLKPTLFHRQIPFSMPTQGPLYAFGSDPKLDSATDAQKSFYLNLPKLELNSSWIKGRRIVSQDAERINHVVVVPRNIGNLDQAYAANLNVTSVQRYGLRSITGETQYSSGMDTTPNKYCAFCADLLSDFFFQSQMFYSGTITTEGVDSHFHVGQNLWIADVGELFHIEAYEIEYENSGREGKNTYTINFQVSRGIAWNGKVANFIANANKSPHKAGTIVKSIIENDPLRGFNR